MIDYMCALRTTRTTETTTNETARELKKEEMERSEQKEFALKLGERAQIKLLHVGIDKDINNL